MKLSIVIPCLNEKKTIENVVQDALNFCNLYYPGQFEILVSDNGSKDGSTEKLKHLPVKILYASTPGYGAALHHGISKAQGKYILFGDADMSYPFSNLQYFKPLLDTDKYDVILGSRFKGRIEPDAMPFLNRYVGTPFLSFLIRFIYKLPTTDCNSGMRAIRKSFYQRLSMNSSGMEWASELLVQSALSRANYIETPIDFKKDQRNRPSHLERWSDGWKHLKSILRPCLSKAAQ